MTTLISRLQQATGADRQLDHDIRRASLPETFMGKPVVRWHQYAWKGGFSCETLDGYLHADAIDVPEFTASVDAALTLVPEGWSLSMGEKRGLPENIRWNVWLHDHNTADDIAVQYVEASAPTPALAICIASLIAHEKGNSSGR